MSIDYVTLEVQADPSGLPNYVQNPSGQLGTYGYITPVANTTLFTVPDGTGYTWLRFSTGATQPSFFMTEFIRISPGEWASTRWNMLATSTAAETARFAFYWYKADGTANGNTVSSGAMTANSYWWTDFQAPAGTAYVRLAVGAYSSGGNLVAGRYITFADLMVTITATNGIATPGFAYSDPVEWTDILGPTSTISIKRGAMDAGTLSALILDANLDPAVADTIRPGRQVRVCALDNTNLPVPIYTGKIDNAKVNYDKAKSGDISDPGAVRIELTAVDNMASLAAQSEARGYYDIDNLTYILEGKGVPWSLNGVGNQPAATVAPNVYNESATLLDQIATTRDSDKGYAWVSAKNVLNVYDAENLSSTIEATFSDASGLSYTAIDASYDTSECINIVNVVHVFWTGTEVVEIPYGPYIDQDSVDTFGPHSRTFSLYAPAGTDFASVAADILTANADPTQKVNSLTMRVKTNAERDAAAALDLYDRASVDYSTVVSGTVRVTGIEHNISPETWSVRYDFGSESIYANPIAPIASRSALDTSAASNNGWTAITLASGWSNFGAGFQTARYKREGDKVYLQGLIKRTGANAGAGTAMFTLPVEARPPAALAYAATLSLNGSAEGVAAVAIGANGAVAVSGFTVQTNGFVYVNFPPFTVN